MTEFTRLYDDALLDLLKEIEANSAEYKAKVRGLLTANVCMYMYMYSIWH